MKDEGLTATGEAGAGQNAAGLMPKLSVFTKLIFLLHNNILCFFFILLNIFVPL